LTAVAREHQTFIKIMFGFNRNLFLLLLLSQTATIFAIDAARAQREKQPRGLRSPKATTRAKATKARTKSRKTKQTPTKTPKGTIGPGPTNAPTTKRYKCLKDTTRAKATKAPTKSPKSTKAPTKAPKATGGPGATSAPTRKGYKCQETPGPTRSKADQE